MAGALQQRVSIEAPGRHRAPHIGVGEIVDRALERRHEIAEPRHYHVADRRVLDDRLELVGEILHDDDADGAGIGKLRAQFARRVQRIDVDHDHAGAQRAQKRHRIGEQVRHHDGDAVAGLELGLLDEEGGEGAAQFVPLGIAQPRAQALERRPRGMAPAGVDQHRRQRGEAVRIDGLRNAGRIGRVPDRLRRAGRLRRRATLHFKRHQRFVPVLASLFLQALGPAFGAAILGIAAQRRSLAPIAGRKTGGRISSCPAQRGKAGPPCAAGWWKGQGPRRLYVVRNFLNRRMPPPPRFASAPPPPLRSHCAGADETHRSRGAPSRPSYAGTKRKDEAPGLIFVRCHRRWDRRHHDQARINLVIARSECDEAIQGRRHRIWIASLRSQ